MANGVTDRGARIKRMTAEIVTPDADGFYNGRRVVPVAEFDWDTGAPAIAYSGDGNGIATDGRRIQAAVLTEVAGARPVEIFDWSTGQGGGVGWPTGALAAGDFVANRYMAGGASVDSADAYTFSRASAGYGDDANGDWALFAEDTLRRTGKGALIEAAETNIVPAPYNLSGWTDSSAVSTAVGGTLKGIFTGAYSIASTGAASNRRRQNTTINFVSGTPYYFRARTMAGSVPSGRFYWQCEAVSPAAGSCVVSGLVGALSNTTSGCGTATMISMALANGVYEATFVFTPNFTGTGRVSLSPGSSTAGQNIIALGVQGGVAPAGSPILGLTTRAADVLTLLATGDYDLRLTFDNGEEQWLLGQTGDFVVDPATLNRSHIASYAMFAEGQSLLYGLADIPLADRVS